MVFVPNTFSVLEVAVIVAVPKFLAMTIPPLVTSMIEGLLEVQVKVLSEVFSGEKVAVNRFDVPM
jgi:hypothetical protein